MNLTNTKVTKMIWFKEYTLEDLNDLRGVQKDNINKHLDIKITEIGDDFLKGTMPVDHRSKQPFGILHGGASCVLAESLGSIAAWMCIDPTKQRAFGLEIHAHHLRPVDHGSVTGICKSLHRGRTLHLWQIDMFNEEGKMNCTCRLSVAIRDIQE
jgi:1,4-dihydroxy-2-naphthoyl-CoA hydrolase